MSDLSFRPPWYVFLIMNKHLLDTKKNHWNKRKSVEPKLSTAPTLSRGWLCKFSRNLWDFCNSTANFFLHLLWCYCIAAAKKQRKIQYRSATKIPFMYSFSGNCASPVPISFLSFFLLTGTDCLSFTIFLKLLVQRHDKMYNRHRKKTYYTIYRLDDT